MSNVLPLVREPAMPAAPAANLSRRMRLVSRALAGLFTALAIGVVAMVALMLLALLVYRGPEARVGPSGTFLVLGGHPPGDTVPVSSLPLAHRLAFIPVVVARMAASFLMLWGLRRLFRLYARGVIFAAENARQIKFIGVWLVADAVIPFALHLIQSALGIEIDRAWFHMVSLQELVLGALVFVIAEVMRIGQAIEHERGEFV